MGKSGSGLVLRQNNHPEVAESVIAKGIIAILSEYQAAVNHCETLHQSYLWEREENTPKAKLLEHG